MKNFLIRLSLGMLVGMILLMASTIYAEIPIKRMKMKPEKRKAIESAVIKVANNPEVDSFTVSNDVLIKDPLNVGASIYLHAGYSAWMTSRPMNVWNTVFSFEPYDFIHNGTVPEKGVSTEDYMECIGTNKLTMAGLYHDGFWNTGEITIYRPEGAYLKTIHKTKIKKYEIFPDGTKNRQGRPFDGRIHYETKGPVAKAGDHYTLRMTLTNPPKAPPFVNTKGKTVYSKLNTGIWIFTGINKAKSGKDSTIDWSIDDSTHCPEGESTASLKMEILSSPPEKATMCGMHSPFLFKGFDMRLHPGKTYKGEIWLKQSGLVGGKAIVDIGEYGHHEFTVGPKWKKFTFDLPNKVPTGKKATKLAVGAASKGTLWVDNMLICSTDTPKFGIYKEYLDELKSYKPSSLRNNHFSILCGTASFDGFLKEGFSERTSVKKSVRHPVGVGLSTFLKICKETGANPWVGINFYNEDECMNLMEYMAGPPTSPYGKIRAKHGQVEPWTSVFDEITIEMGNEVWNYNFAPLAFSTEVFSQVSNTMFRWMKSSSYYQKDKFVFSSGGRIAGAGHIMDGKFKINKDGKELCGYSGGIMKYAHEADMTSVGCYIGGWDGMTTLESMGNATADLYKMQLLYPAYFMESRILDHIKSREMLGRTPGKSDNPIQLGMYEMGPGYAVFGSKEVSDQPEKVGKSLAMGIATLDLAMFVQECNFRSPSIFFKFHNGKKWVSHNNMTDKIPNAPYLALKLRNTQCEGDMLKVAADVLSVDLPDKFVTKARGKQGFVEKLTKGRKNIPMVKFYAFKKDKRYSYLALSRSFDEARKIKINVPYDPESKAEIYTLTHEDPRETNIEKLNYDIEKIDVSDFKNGYTFTLPPSSAFVIVNYAK